ncbi:MAG: hypothetical protein AAGC70_15830 [Pseudomonadota bacterium]
MNFFGRVRTYLLGRNFVIGIASLMLLVISGFATWSGMSDFIIGASGSGTDSVGRSIGGIPVTNDAVIIAIVAALTLLMWIALREAFGIERTASQRLIMFPLYLFLALWSVGFGYGFWWSLIAGQEATRTSMSALQEDARDATGAIAARLDAVKIQLDNVVAWSNAQMSREEASGGSCGVSSGAGRGPLYNARQSVRDTVASLRTNIAENWLAPVQRELENLRSTAGENVPGTSLSERQARFEARAASIRSSARNIAARSNELGKSTAAEMNALAVTVSAAPGDPSFSCYDPTLAQRLRQAALQAAQPAVLNLRDATFNEGPAGVANAVKNLWTNIGAGINTAVYYVSAGSIGTADGGMEGQPITGRDLIALLATLGVDIGLFALTAFNPPPPARHTVPFEAREQIRSAIQRAISSVNDTPNIPENMKIDVEWIRKHLVHHRRHSYFIIPNLYSCDLNTLGEKERALAMNKLAGVLDDLHVVRWPHPRRWRFGKSELERLKMEEKDRSTTDLSDLRREVLDELKSLPEDERKEDRERHERKLQNAPLRNHGLFSKAEVALASAGWSERAQADIEVFVLTDTEGLTPLLEVLNTFKPSEMNRPVEPQETSNT